MKKRIMAILICAAVVLSLTGCGESDNEKPNDSTPTSTSEKSEKTPSSADIQSSTDNQSTTESTASVDSKPEESKPEGNSSNSEQSSTNPEGNSKPVEPPVTPGGAIDWDSVPYANETDFRYSDDYDDGVTITGYTGKETVLKIPPTVDGKKVVSVFFPFSGTDICSPDSVTEFVGFGRGENLRSAAILGGKIGEQAFSGCKNLESVTLSSGVTEIGELAFENCSKLKSITMPDSVTQMGRGVFYGCMALESVNIPKSSVIPAYMFSGCLNLKNITIPNGVTSIGERAFYFCKSLTSITIPDGVIYIGGQAFSECDNLTSVTIGDSVKSSPEGGYFARCNESIEITFKGKTYKYGDLNNLYQDITNNG